MTAALLLFKGAIIDIYNYDRVTSSMLNLTLIAYAAVYDTENDVLCTYMRYSKIGRRYEILYVL